MIRQRRMKLKFARSLRLHRRFEFRFVKTSGKSWTGTYLILAVSHRETDLPSRVGIITTRRIGNAVIRNRVRRRIREIYRLNQRQVKKGYWIVTMARISATSASYQDLERDWLRLAKRASILAPTSHGSNPADPSQSV